MSGGWGEDIQYNLKAPYKRKRETVRVRVMPRERATTGFEDGGGLGAKG